MINLHLDHDKAEYGPSPKGICSICGSINIQALASSRGFKHLTVGSTLRESAKRCSLCQHLTHRTEQAAGLHNGKYSADGCAVRLKLKRYCADTAVSSFGAVVEILFEDYKPAIFKHDFFAVNTITKGRKIFTAQYQRGNFSFSLFIDSFTLKFVFVLPINHVTTTSSKKSFATARSWINNCLKYHPQCSQSLFKSENSAQPKRLIDLHSAYGSGPDGVIIKLVELPEISRCPSYIALSYCWGYSSGESYTTTKDNVRRHMNQIPYAKLPATLKDAVRICTKLGMRYLWIDALCIVQDCSKDMDNEVAKMAMIYQKAWLTISVDISKASTEGCFNDGRKHTLLTLEDGVGFKVDIPTVLDNGFKSKLRLFSPVATFSNPDAIQGTPLTTRAWTFQEQALSRRILHYTSSGLVWECRAGFISQDNILHWDRNSDTLPSLPTKISALSSLEIVYVWYHEILTMSYSLRELTFASDKLPAISAVAALFHQHLQSPYLAGIWLQNIEIGLSWRRCGLEKRKDAKNSRPSWSWRSQVGMVNWPISKYYLDDDFVPLIEIESFDTSLTNQATPFGNVKNGTLVILGFLNRLRVRKVPADDERYVKYELLNQEGKKLGSAVPDLEIEDEVEFHCLALFCRFSNLAPGHFSVWLLLVSPIAGKTGAYTRDGVAEIDEVDSWKSLGNDKTSRITLL
ncbi:heterokaryon incompatibility protein [Cordyceps javanica]|uniref:Heterokaryon incompatibility protein n=1 Tax=Cordyceps javanica TaxID=43265 RepID=A0A545V1J9_9HYPO|nr:heterokaryon incompatibility protein [Cordyceps javanica]